MGDVVPLRSTKVVPLLAGEDTRLPKVASRCRDFIKNAAERHSELTDVECTALYLEALIRELRGISEG